MTNINKKSKPIACLYVVFDQVSQRYGDIFQVENDDAARRQFTEIFKRNFGNPHVPVRDLAIVRLASIEPSDDPDEFWPVIANMSEPIFVLKGSEINYDEVRETAHAASSDNSVSEVL